MKQNITEEQLEELNETQKENMRKYLTSKDGITGYYIVGSWDIKNNKEGKKNYSRPRNLKLLSIGQMIEFLGEDWHDFVIKSVEDYGDVLVPYQPEELCDKLWEACKQVLKEK